MDITKAKKVIRLSKEGREVLVTLWQNDKISSCVQEQETTTQYCETCEGDEELCSQFVNYLKEKGYEATEVPLGELALEESLPRFLEGRVKPEVTPSEEE